MQIAFLSNIKGASKLVVRFSCSAEANTRAWPGEVLMSATDLGREG